MAYFQIEQQEGPPGSVLLALEGELDMGSAGELTVAFEPLVEQRRRLLLDLSRLDFIDVSGLRAMVSGLAGARDAGCQTEVCGELSWPVHRVIELVGAGEAIWPPV